MNKEKIEDKLNYIDLGNKLLEILDKIEEYDNLKWFIINIKYM